MLMKSIFSFLVVLVISHSALATVTCLTQKSETVLTVQLNADNSMDYGYLNLGESEDIARGQTQEFSPQRFYFAGVAGAKKLTIDIDLRSDQVDNGLLTIDGKPQRVNCFTSQIPLAD
jgi:hypothetical protein